MMSLKQTSAISDRSLTVRLQAVGDSVTEDEVVCEIETDKVRDGKTLRLQQDLTAPPLNSQNPLLSTDLSAGSGPGGWSDRGAAGARWGQSGGRNAPF